MASCMSSAKNNSIVALNAATGKETWTYAMTPAPSIITNRGINYWESKDGRERRLLFCANHALRAIDAQTGKPITTFGDNGSVDLKEGLGRDPKTSDAGAVDHAGPRLRGPDHPGLGDESGLRLRRPATSAPSTSAPASSSGPSTPSRGPASSATTRGRRTRGRPSAAPTSGASSRSTRSAASSTRRPPVRNTTSTARTARAPTCSAIACSRSTRAPASASGTSRWCTTTSGTTTTRPRPSC